MPMSNEEKVRENLARRRVERRGLRLSKSRIRDPHAIGYGTWTITGRGMRPVVLAGIEEVEAWLDGER